MANGTARVLLEDMRILLAALLTLTATPALRPGAAGEPGDPVSFSPRGTCAGTGSVRWSSLAPAADREMLDRWCDSVGPPFVTAAGTPPPSIATLVIATWNVHAGNGDVEAFLGSVARLSPVRAPYAVVLLLQEVVRSSVEVPRGYPARMRPPGSIRAHRNRQAVVDLAEQVRMHAAYVPSMRNGRIFQTEAREDRGNAVLSTLPLDDVRALELPFGQQRHVAVAARVRVPGLPRLRVISVHLDPSGHRTDEALALATHVRRWAPSDETLVIGGDLNTWFGRREAALSVLADAAPEEPCGTERTNSWPWRLQGPLGWWRGRLDYMFSTLPKDVMRSCMTLPEQFGSDHRPVVLMIPLQP